MNDIVCDDLGCTRIFHVWIVVEDVFRSVHTYIATNLLGVECLFIYLFIYYNIALAKRPFRLANTLDPFARGCTLTSVFLFVLFLGNFFIDVDAL